MKFTVVIPARYHSQRLPKKVLLDIAGKPMVQRVYEQACQSDAAAVIVATDDERIANVVRSFGGRCCMTFLHHPSGTDRIQEVISRESLPDDTIVVNVQGDEPLIPPGVINQVADNLHQNAVQMATLYEPIESLDDVLDPNIVKVVSDRNDMALYFSRAPIPWDRDNFPGSLSPGIQFKRHIGIYAYRASLLNQYVRWEPDDVEVLESLEQLRVLRHGIKIHVAKAVEQIPPGIDTEKDLLRTRAMFK